MNQPKTNLNLKKATFAGGCFWCMQPPYDKIEGVVSVTSGYTGGHVKKPTYEEVSEGTTGHAEAVEITYDPAKTSYETLLEVFWHNIDPTTKNQQFADIGSQYRTAIFYHDEEQKNLAFESKEKLEKSKRFKNPVVTEIVPASGICSFIRSLIISPAVLACNTFPVAPITVMFFSSFESRFSFINELRLFLDRGENTVSFSYFLKNFPASCVVSFM